MSARQLIILDCGHLDQQFGSLVQTKYGQDTQKAEFSLKLSL
jgi:hypothetical protein